MTDTPTLWDSPTPRPTDRVWSPLLGDREPWHGSTSGYGRHGCRCDDCRRAHRDAARRFYARRRRILAGEVVEARPGPWERFHAKVVEVGGCWLWTAATFNGYGAFWAGTEQVRAHRWVYERLTGPIPDGLEVDHVCGVRGCVNPTHLEAVTPTENKRRASERAWSRGTGWGWRGLRRAVCVKGHVMDELNTYVRPSGKRECRACMKARPRKPRKGAK